jgi:hypothetical protein
MGAEWFYETGEGESAKAVFDEIVAQALYDHGHAGYSGTIAEKSEFKMVSLPEGVTPEHEDLEEVAYEIPEEEYTRDGKWGPAGCFDLGDGKYAFFGYASS